MIIAAMLLTLTALPAAAPTVAIAFQPAVGLSDEELSQSRQRLVLEVEGLGAIVDTNAPAVDPACVPDPTCVDAARAALPTAPAGLIVVELLRVGPVVQLTASASSPSGAASGSHGLDPDQLAHGPLLPADVSAWVTGLLPAAPPPPPPPPPPAVEPGLSPMRTGAIVVGAGGAIAAAAGLLFVAINAPVLEDPDSLGADKERAVSSGLVGFGATVIGLAVLGAGIGIFLTSE